MVKNSETENQSFKKNNDLTVEQQEQQRKRELQRQQHQKRMKPGGTINPEQLIKSSDKFQKTQETRSQESVKGEGFSSSDQPAKDFSSLKKGNFKQIKQAAQSTLKGDSQAISQSASVFILNSLWGSLFTLIGFFPALLGLNIYFFASTGLLDIIFLGLSKRIAPFGIMTHSLPQGLGKILGIIVLFSLNFLALVLLSIFFVMIVLMVTAITDPWGLAKQLSGFVWDAFKSLFSQ
jgi:hypothetical protein